MYAVIFASHMIVHQQGDDRDWLEYVEAVLFNHTLHFGNLFGYLSEYFGVALYGLVIQILLCNVHAFWKANLVVFSCFSRLSVLRLRALCLRALSPLRNDFFDVHWR